MRMKNVKIAILLSLIITASVALVSTNVEYCTGALNKFTSYSALRQFLQNDYDSESNSDVLGMRGLESSRSSDDYSRTNVQVEGVDEADIVKTDGEYIYAKSGQSVIIVRASPADGAAVLSRITVNGTLWQIFVNRDKLVVFYQTCSQLGPQSYYEARTSIAVFDVVDKREPTLVREATVDGDFFSARMIGDYVYAVVTKYAGIIEGKVMLPRVLGGNGWSTVDATEVYYVDMPNSHSIHLFATILALNVQDDLQEPAYQTILVESMTTIYVSMQNLYLASGSLGKTFLHRIRFDNGEISYAGNGEVKGSLLNQFSMDEYEGYFRAVTTSYTETPQDSWRQLNLESNLYVLDMSLTIIGSIEHIAPGEQVHSVRFMGDIGYIVTFRKVDPFFAVDLSNPYSPRMLGELKITGYSDYLHIYDESHVIGVGKETVAAEEGDFSWYQGLKISVFDVTDIREPKELAKHVIGDRGTYSPVLGDHKAFLFDKEKKLLAMPVSVAEVNKSMFPNGASPYTYGDVVWQGAYVFAVSLESEEILELRGRITHVDDGDLWNMSKQITRALYIGDVLYTVSESMIKMNALTDLSEIGELRLN